MLTTPILKNQEGTPRWAKRLSLRPVKIKRPRLNQDWSLEFMCDEGRAQCHRVKKMK